MPRMMQLLRAFMGFVQWPSESQSPAARGREYEAAAKHLTGFGRPGAHEMAVKL